MCSALEHRPPHPIYPPDPIVKPSGYRMYRLEGTMTGRTVIDPVTKQRIQYTKEGVFEIGVTPSGVIDHRFFRPKE